MVCVMVDQRIGVSGVAGDSLAMFKGLWCVVQ